MKNSMVLKYLKDASLDISEMISMVNKNVNCIQILKKSKETRIKIQIAKTLMFNNFLKSCATDLFKQNKKEKLTEIMRINKYR